MLPLALRNASCFEHCVHAAEMPYTGRLSAEELELFAAVYFDVDQQPCRRPHTRSVSRQMNSITTKQQTDLSADVSTATSPAPKRKKVQHKQQMIQSDAAPKAAANTRKRAVLEVSTIKEPSSCSIGVSGETRCVKKRNTQQRAAARPAPKGTLRRSARATQRVDYSEQDADLNEVPVVAVPEPLFRFVPRRKRSARSTRPRTAAARNQSDEPEPPRATEPPRPVVPRRKRSAKSQKPKPWR